MGSCAGYCLWFLFLGNRFHRSRQAPLGPSSNIQVHWHPACSSSHRGESHIQISAWVTLSKYHRNTRSFRTVPLPPPNHECQNNCILRDPESWKNRQKGQKVLLTWHLMGREGQNGKRLKITHKQETKEALQRQKGANSSITIKISEMQRYKRHYLPRGREGIPFS